MKTLTTNPAIKGFAVFLCLLAGCASSPEATLMRGYNTADAVVVGATLLVNRDQLSVTDATNVHTLGVTAKATLDGGKDALKACRAIPNSDCKGASATIDLGAGVLGQLEAYLLKMEVK